MNSQKIISRCHTHLPVILRSFATSSRRQQGISTKIAPRPGAAAPEDHERTSISAPEVEKWVDFMKSQGVQRVVSLLDESEITGNYSFDLPAVMSKEFNAYTNVNMKAPGAAQQLREAFDAAATADEKVVVHCWGGSGRTGQALGTWLVHHYNITPEEAAKKVMEAAEAAHVDRQVAAAKLSKFVA